MEVPRQETRGSMSSLLKKRLNSSKGFLGCYILTLGGKVCVYAHTHTHILTDKMWLRKQVNIQFHYTIA